MSPRERADGVAIKVGRLAPGFECQTCRRLFQVYENYVRHVVRCRGPGSPQSPPRSPLEKVVYDCDVCGASYATSEAAETCEARHHTAAGTPAGQRAHITL